MAIDLTGIANQNEFFSQHYLSAVFEQDLNDQLKAWADAAAEDKEQRAPYDRISALRRDYFALQERKQRLHTPVDLWNVQKPVLQELFSALGYAWRESVREMEDGACCPVVGEVKRPDGSPWLWMLAVASDPSEPDDPLGCHLLDRQYPEELDPKVRMLNDDLETIITRQIFAVPEPPRWLMLCNDQILLLIDRSKWSEKRLLCFDLREILDRRESSTLKAMAALLHREHICPESGTSLLDTLDENSHKHAFSVSEDLKYSAREAVELLGNEAVYYMRTVSHEKMYDRKLAEQLTDECLRYLYRLLFLFYLEARPEKLRYIPMKNDAYRTGYSLDALRELEMTPLTTSEARDGYFFDESIRMLFQLINEGFRPENQQEMALETPLHDEFSIDRVESHLFDPQNTPLLRKIKVRNHVWQQVIQLLSLTRPQKGKNERRGRISYAQLGISQLGAVYEGLLSYRGFFAETDLYEVKKAGEDWNPLHQAYFVPEEAVPEYADAEKVYEKGGKVLKKHEKGRFIYRLAGRDREKSASYYTPTSLTQCLVKYALKELIGEKSTEENWKTADEILNLTVCEPAMGSAAFLNEAINQLADAYIRRKQVELDTFIPHDRIEEETQKIRMVLADNNVFGIDLNPVAVELAEISLWLNSIHAGNFVPWFGFQLQCGNSLIGARRQTFESYLLTPQKSAARNQKAAELESLRSLRSLRLEKEDLNREGREGREEEDAEAMLIKQKTEELETLRSLRSLRLEKKNLNREGREGREEEDAETALINQKAEELESLRSLRTLRLEKEDLNREGREGREEEDAEALLINQKAEELESLRSLRTLRLEKKELNREGREGREEEDAETALINQKEKELESLRSLRTLRLEKKNLNREGREGREEEGNPNQTWRDVPPERVLDPKLRNSASVYHFLLPDPGMAEFSDKIIKKMAQNELETIKNWKKSFLEPFSDADIRLLERLSLAIDRLWDEHTQQLHRLREETTDTFPFFGHEDIKQKQSGLAWKDRKMRQEYFSENIKNSSPYRRLKMVMDYWCALWFWPIQQTDQLPTRESYLLELQYILEGSPVQEFGSTDDPNGQMILFPETAPRQQMLDLAEKLGYVDVDGLCKTFPRLNLVQKIAEKHRFLHWELEFADIFDEKGGFDLVLGNPPWIKVEWNESGLLSDFQPLFAVKKLSASKVADLRAETIEKFDLLDAYYDEYVAQSATQNFLNALCNYPVLKNVQTNLYKCFLPQAWMIGNEQGVSGFVHPEGVYDDPKGGVLRSEIYARLRDHFQFDNELKLFPEVHHCTKFSINVFKQADTEKNIFLHIANLFAVSTIDECMQECSPVAVGGIKDENNKWNTAGHPDRVIHVDQEALELFARLYDAPGTPWQQARLPSVHSVQVLDVLRKFAAYPKRLGDLEGEYKSTVMWDETNAVKKDHTIRRETQFPADPSSLILSGPHFYVGNPFNKTPRDPCTKNSDYDVIDLTEMPADYLPRTNYVPDCDPAEYRRRTPSVPWDATGETNVTDCYQMYHRRMLSQSGERTLIASIISKGIGAINTVVVTAFKNPISLLGFVSSCNSIPFDFFLKSTGRGDLYGESLVGFPIVDDERINCRGKLLYCTTENYLNLWLEGWSPSFINEQWTNNDPRLPADTFSKLTSDWQWEYPLRTDYARRQALVEIDVLVARALGLTVDELCAIYRIQFPVLRQNENDTWYDQNGRIIFTCSKGLPGVGFSRPEWDNIKNMKSGAVERPVIDNWLPEPRERTIIYQAPFDRCDREQDYHTAWQAFDEREKNV
ncbi:MAG: hypothetical protein EOM12_03905 [Verrucomicrobiae bacterium]|nr:hypothetical protein [Verrucomicrobiae bacterium]